MDLLPTKSKDTEWYKHFREALQNPEASPETKRRYKLLVDFLDNTVRFILLNKHLNVIIFVPLFFSSVISYYSYELWRDIGKLLKVMSIITNITIICHLKIKCVCCFDPSIRWQALYISWSHSLSHSVPHSIYRGSLFFQNTIMYEFNQIRCITLLYIHNN